MKNLKLSTLVFLLLISLNVFSQDGKFTFNIGSSVNTSAGVFKSDGTLVRTLWNNERYSSGTYTKTWDGKDDQGAKVTSPDAAYQIKILTNNVQYAWQGTLGNTSDNMTGESKHRGYFYCMRGIAFGPKYGYFCTGYSEGSPTMGKFLISQPNTKINYNILDPSTYKADINYVATDDINVYWGAMDSNSPFSFVYANKVSDDSEVAFSNSEPYSVKYGRTYPSVIAKVGAGGPHFPFLITGLAVQKKGNYLFVARAAMNQVQVVNKTTGALVQTLNYTSPKGISVDGSDNLWMITGTNTVAKYAVNSDGTLSLATLKLSGLLEPSATQVSPDGTLITVVDAAVASQQVKFFSNSTGAATYTLGDAGGYTSDATVTDNKFYFKDNNTEYDNPRLLNFLAYEPDGSFWVGDPGNFRVQHYNSGRNFINRIMYLGATYAAYVDKNNINRVFAEYLEFEIDYSRPLSGSTGWKLKKNWGANVTTGYDIFTKIKYQTTLSNGRTYGFIRPKGGWEIIEFPSSGQLRFTGVIIPTLTNLLCSDGSLQDYTTSGSTATFKRFPLTGFDASGNPIWNPVAEILATAQTDEATPSSTGNAVAIPSNQMFTTTNKVVLFNYHSTVAYATGIHKGYHLGLMQKGANNTYLFQTEKSTHRNYVGGYPAPGYFDVGNTVNDFAGGSVNIVDRNIVTSYHGEFWKGSQTNKFNHYYDNGLAIGQFGITRPETNSAAAAMMAGNALAPVMVKDANGDLYLYHGDESDHSGIHRWKITGLNTISEQVITIPFPSGFKQSTAYFTDLMAGLPYDATLINNTAGWTRNPVSENESDPFNNLWRVNTSRQSYDNIASNDVTVEFVSSSATSASVSRDLGKNKVNSSWKISGEVVFPNSVANGRVGQQYLEVMDSKDKILTSFYIAASAASTTVFGNTVPIVSSAGYTVLETMNWLPFEVKIVNGNVTFTYGNNTPVTTNILDASGNWQTPQTLRIRYVRNNGSGPAYSQTIAIKDFKFYKDYSGTPTPPPPTNQAPVASAGADIAITLPITSASLNGNGTDVDGTISSYSWAKILGPLSGVIVTPNAANTQINNLTPGTYQFELTVTDNNGAIGKDIVEVQVQNLVKAPAPVTENFVVGTDLLPAVYPGNTANGLDYKYYEGKWDVLPDFSALDPVKTGTASNFDLSLANAPTLYGFSFTGFINVPADGQYQFYATSDDGSNLYIDGVLTVANDGLHGAIEKWGTIGLKAGLHAISGLYFQQGGGQVFNVSYEGMGISKQPVPTSSLFRVTLPVANNFDLLPAVDPGPTVNGLDYKYYEGKWDALPDFNSLDPVKTGTTSNFDISLANSPTQYGFNFTGFINVPLDGKYQFYTTSDDGSNLYIDGVLTVANDGLHGPVEKSGTIGLKAGLHAISGLYFQQGGGQVFDVSYEGIGISKQTIPASALYRVTVDAFTSYNLLPAVNPANTVNGLDYKYYEGNWNSLPSFPSLNPVNTGNTNNFNLSMANRHNQYGCSFTGFINVPADGQYTFYTTSDDGSSLLIDNVTTVSNDALQEATEKSGTIGLKAGKHAITGLYFQQGGDQVFRVSYEGMGISKQDIPSSALYRVNSAPLARAGTDQSITLPSNTTILSGNGTDSDGTITSYDWVMVSGPSSGIIEKSNLATAKASNLVQGVYQYQLTVRDNNGAISTDKISVTVNPPAAVVIAQVKSPTAVNNSTISKFAYINAVKVFPNPAKDMVNVSITSTGINNKLTISVYNSIGMMVKFKELSTTLITTTCQLDLYGLTDGMFNIVVGFDDGQKINYKLLKKR